MLKILQKDAVYEVAMKVLEENNVSFEEGMDTLADVMDKDIRSCIVSTLIDMFEQNKIVMNKQHKGKELRRYVSALVSNWSAKDPRLNGNIKHTIKNPGIKIGTTDPMVRELRRLLKQVKSTKHESAVKKELDNRLTFIRKEQAKSITINRDLIPDDLKYLVRNEIIDEKTTDRH